MSTTCKVSIILPVYNGEKHLDKSLTSLIQQTFFDQMEILVIDDGSTDNSGVIVDSYAKMHSQIKVFHIPNGGVSNARNLGLSHAAGEYISFVDADDWVDPDCYETMYTQAAANQADIVASGIFIDEQHGTLLSIRTSEENISISGEEACRRLLYGALDVHVWNKLFKRQIACDVHFNRDIRIGEDKLYLYECLLKSKCVCLLNTSYYHYFQNESSAMRQSFSEKFFDDVFVGEQILKLTSTVYPPLYPYAECMNINALCRIVGDISIDHHAKSTNIKQYRQLLHQVRKFSICKSIRYSSKKHWMSLLVAKISPKLYGHLRSDKRLRYTKG